MKISRGYRLRISTHNIIKNLQELTESDSDDVISKSCRLYMKNLFEQEENIKLSNNSYENKK